VPLPWLVARLKAVISILSQDNDEVQKIRTSIEASHIFHGLHEMSQSETMVGKISRGVYGFLCRITP
jgi:hypothetical protein